MREHLVFLTFTNVTIVYTGSSLYTSDFSLSSGVGGSNPGHAPLTPLLREEACLRDFPRTSVTKISLDVYFSSEET